MISSAILNISGLGISGASSKDAANDTATSQSADQFAQVLQGASEASRVSERDSAATRRTDDTERTTDDSDKPRSKSTSKKSNDVKERAKDDSSSTEKTEDGNSAKLVDEEKTSDGDGGGDGEADSPSKDAGAKPADSSADSSTDTSPAADDAPLVIPVLPVLPRALVAASTAIVAPVVDTNATDTAAKITDPTAGVATTVATTQDALQSTAPTATAATAATGATTATAATTDLATANSGGAAGAKLATNTTVAPELDTQLTPVTGETRAAVVLPSFSAAIDKTGEGGAGEAGATAKAATQPVDATSSMAGLNATQRVEKSLDLSSLSSTKQATPAALAEPYRQVVHIVQPLRGRDGDYNLSLVLNPEHLGRVEVQVSIQNGGIDMQMNADDPNARQLLRDSLNDLRSALNDSGLTAGSLDVGTQDSSEQSGQNAQGERSRNNKGKDIELTDDELFARLATTNTNQPSSDGQLNIQL